MSRHSLIVSIFPLSPLVLYSLLFYYPSLGSPCVTYRMQCHSIGHQVLRTQPMPREAEDFSRGDKNFKHVPLLTCLIYFSRKGVYMLLPIYMPKSPRETLISL